VGERFSLFYIMRLKINYETMLDSRKLNNINILQGYSLAVFYFYEFKTMTLLSSDMSQIQ